MMTAMPHWTNMHRSIALVLLLALASCGPPTSVDVVVTTTFLGEAVAAIAGEDLTYHVLMRPGVDPHLYRPSAHDVERILGSRLLIYHGLHLEGRLTDVLSKLRDRAWAATSALDPSTLLSVSEEEKDPHVWWDPSLWAQVVDSLVTRLAAMVPPDRREALGRRGEEYRRMVLRTGQEAAEVLSSIPPERRVLVTAHDAFQYFGRAFDFEVHAIQGVSTATEASARVIADLALMVASRRIPAVFFESTISPRTVQALQEAAQSLGWQLVLGGELFSDSTGDTAETATWRGAFLHNVHTIARALGGEP